MGRLRPAGRPPLSASPEDSAARDRERIEAYLHGDREVSKLFRDWVEVVVQHRAWGLERREDLAQEVLLRLLVVLGRGGFEGRSSLKTYVQRVAKYTCIDALRRERRVEFQSWEEMGEPDLPSHDEPGKEWEAEQTARLCYAVLDQLPEPCRQLLRRVLAEDASYEELAGEFSIAVGTVKSRVARCRERAEALRARILRSSRLRREVLGR